MRRIIYLSCANCRKQLHSVERWQFWYII